MAPFKIYKFRAVLKDVQPKIWRMFEMAGSATIEDLALVTMAIFRMSGSHLYDIDYLEKGAGRAGLKHFEPGENDGGGNPFTGPVDGIIKKAIADMFGGDFPIAGNQRETLDPTKHRLSKLVEVVGSKFLMNYDFGDSWEVAITVRDIYEDPAVKKKMLPRVLKGAGYGIVDDVGGTRGLMEFANTLRKKKGKEYKEAIEWLNAIGVDEFDIEDFDLEEIDAIAKEMPDVIRSLREMF
jgi:hypothetical protein